MKRKINLSILMLVLLFIALSFSTSKAYEKCGYGYSYTEENGYIFSMQAPGISKDVGHAGEKINIKDYLMFAPEWHDWLYDYDTNEWFEFFPALEIDSDNLKVISSDESKIMITREDGEIYLNYIEATDEVVTISVEYTYDNYTYLLEVDWGVDEGTTNTSLIYTENIDYLYGSDIKDGYELYINAFEITGYEYRPGTVGKKDEISHYLKFAPEDNDYIYDSASHKWVEINPALTIDESNLEVTSSDESIIKVTRENGKTYLNYLKSTDDNDVILTIKYTYNGTTYVVKTYWGVWNEGENGVTRAQKENNSPIFFTMKIAIEVAIEQINY